MLLEPRNQRPVLHRKADAVNKDQGLMEQYIGNVMKGSQIQLLDKQEGCLRHISTLMGFIDERTLDSPGGDVSLV